MPNTDERNRIAEQHLHLVEATAAHSLRRFPPSVTLDDLRSDGFLRLLTAAASYDPKKGASFETHAIRAIRNGFADGLRERDWLKRYRRSQSPDVKVYQLDASAPDRTSSERPGIDLDRLDAFAWVVRGLSERERAILELYFLRHMTLAGIAKEVGLTESRVSQIRLATLSRLRDAMTREKFADNMLDRRETAA